MTSDQIIGILQQSPLVTCEPKMKGVRVSLSFSIQPPDGPGVYAIYQLNPEKPFYVGEAGSLHQRLKFLFRCHRNDNPHPCQKRYEQVHGNMPEFEDLCSQYGVRWISTAGQWGRLEYEEVLQQTFGTNSQAFYLNYNPEKPAQQQCPPAKPPELCIESCDSKAPCSECPIWRELSTNEAYRKPEGVEIPTMGGQATNLRFCYDANSERVRVWRETRKPNFTFDRADCHALCRRYRQGLSERELPLTTELGGTSYFADSAWVNPVLGRIRTPYAAAVIRHVWLALRLPGGLN